MPRTLIQFPSPEPKPRIAPLVIQAFADGEHIETMEGRWKCGRLALVIIACREICREWLQFQRERKMRRVA